MTRRRGRAGARTAAALGAMRGRGCAAAAAMGVAIGAFAGAPAARAQQTLTTAQIAKRWGASIVTITTPGASGTGFFLPNGALVTAYHVLRGADSADIVFPDGRRGKVTGVMVADQHLDLAMLICDAFPPVTHVASSAGRSVDVVGPLLGDYAAVSPGDKVVVIGSPLGLEQTVTEGIVSAKRSEDGVSRLQLSAGISAGSSGSPVFNDQGQVIGVVVFTYTQGQLLNFALGSDALKTQNGVPLAVVFGSRAPHAGPSDEERLDAIQDDIPPSPPDAPDEDLQAARRCPSIAINVKFDSSQHDGVDAADVEKWAGAEILRSAPGLRLTHLVDSDQLPSLWSPSLIDTITKFDDAGRNLLIRVYSPPNVGAQLDVVRAGVTLGGMYPIKVFQAENWAPSGAHDFPGDARACVQAVIREFANLWMDANHPKPAPATAAAPPPAAASVLPPPPPERSPQ